MKKVMKLIFVSFFCLMTCCGCSTLKREIEKENYNAYISYYQSILDETDKQTSSQCFDITINVNKMADDNYIYDVIINNAKVAMYEVKIMAVIDEIGAKIDNTKAMPSIGILDNQKYSIVPGQNDKESGYVDGFYLSLISDKPNHRIGIMVDYLDSTKTNRVRQYFSIYCQYIEETEAQ